MEMGWQFGGSLVAVLSLQLQVKGDIKTATKLPPNCHQTATKLPPNCHQTATKIPPTFHQNDTTMMAKIKKKQKDYTKHVPQCHLCLWDEGFCQSNMLN